MSVADEPPTRFGVAANPESGETVISVHGDINEGSASELRVILDVEIGQSPRSLVVDLGNLGDMDSSGLVVLADAAKRLADLDGHLRIASPSPAVSRLLEVVGLTAGQQSAWTHPALPLPGQPVGSSPALDATTIVLQMVVSLTQAIIGGADGVSVSLRRDGHLSTVAASDQTITDMDASQYATGTGPCIDAAEEGRWFCTESLAAESRWPAFTPQARALGINAILSSPLLSGDHPVGALNIYSRSEGAFTDDDHTLASVFATEASRILVDAENVAWGWPAGVDEALQHRAVISQAQGVIMERVGVDPELAYTLIRRFASESGNPLLDRAREVVASTQRPDPLPVGRRHD